MGDIYLEVSLHTGLETTLNIKEGSIPFIQTGDVARAKDTIVTSMMFIGNANGVALEQIMAFRRYLCITIAANIADSGIAQ